MALYFSIILNIISDIRVNLVLKQINTSCTTFLRYYKFILLAGSVLFKVIYSLPNIALPTNANRSMTVFV